MPSDTIDITDLVEKMRSTFVTVESEATFAWLQSLPGLQWLASPIINVLVRKGISALFNFLSRRSVMMAFFLNTAIRKASQAKDYVEAVEAKHKLPPGVSDEEYERHELAEIAAFDSFVRAVS